MIEQLQQLAVYGLFTIRSGGSQEDSQQTYDRQLFPGHFCDSLASLVIHFVIVQEHKEPEAQGAAPCCPRCHHLSALPVLHRYQRVRPHFCLCPGITVQHWIAIAAISTTRPVLQCVHKRSQRLWSDVCPVSPCNAER